MVVFHSCVNVYQRVHGQRLVARCPWSSHGYLIVSLVPRWMPWAKKGWPRRYLKQIEVSKNHGFSQSSLFLHSFRYGFSIVLPCHPTVLPKKNKETHGEGRLNREPPLRCKELRAVFKVIPLALTPSNIIPSNLRYDPGCWRGDESALGVSWRYWVLLERPLSSSRTYCGCFETVCWF